MSSKRTNQQIAITPKGLAITIALAIAVIVAILFVGVRFINATSDQINTSIASLKKEVAAIASAKQDPVAFEAAVARSLESLAARKQQEMVEAKYAKYQAAAETVPGDKSIYGNVNARFTLVEFSDLECPYCKRFHNTPKEIVDASQGNINWEWKHLPLSFHNPAARKEALAAECVREQQGNRGFWVFLDDVFANSRGNGQGVPDLDGLIAGVGADVQKAQQCMDEGRYDDKIDADLQMAASNGINGTPATFVVDNTTGRHQLLTGAQPAAAFMAAIRKMMAETNEEMMAETNEEETM